MNRKRNGFTVVELLMVVSIIGILTALVSAVAGNALQQSKSATCISNLRQWGIALNLYCADHDGYTPRRGQGVQPVWVINRPDDWFNALPPYFNQPSYNDDVQQGHPAKPGDKSVFVCPAAEAEPQYANFLCYGMNMYLSPWIRPQPHKLQELPNPSQLAFMADAPGGWASTIPSSQGYSVKARHNGRANVVFIDGHVQSFNGGYLGCGKGEPNPELPDVRWQTLTDGINQSPMP